MSKNKEKELDVTEVAETEEQDTGYQPVLRSGMLPSEQDDNLDMSGLTPPRLQIAHGVGGLSEAGFNPGSLVLAGEALLAEKEKPIRIIVVAKDQYWKEYMSGDDFAAGLRPRQFKTEQDAIAAGMRTRWGHDGEAPDVSLAMDMMILIEKPEAIVSGLFAIEANGKLYAPALYTVDKTAYKTLSQTFLPASKYTLARRYGRDMAATWELSTFFHKKTKNGTWAPRLKLVSYNSEEEVNALRDALGFQDPAEG